jgi:photosystem II PsbU protein
MLAGFFRQALVPGAVMRASAPAARASPMMSEECNRREVISKVLGSATLLAATAANADIDYAGVGFLGGSSTIDVNNANIRVYTKLPGMYPGAAGKIVSNVPYKGKEDMYSKCGFTAEQAAATKKYDGKFIFLEPRPEYVIDNINNGLYR